LLGARSLFEQKSIDAILLGRCRQLAVAIENLHAESVLPVFVILYDEYWQLMRSLSRTLEQVVGSRYRVTCDLWVWCIQPGAQRRGWKPHRDSNFTGVYDPATSFIRRNGSPRLFTMWIPLTDATTHNSCIYVLPFPKDSVMRFYLGGASLRGLHAASKKISQQWSKVRALPAAAGSILAWSTYILHWGSESTEWTDAPRVSIFSMPRDAVT